MGYFLLILGILMVLGSWRPAMSAWRGAGGEAGTFGRAEPPEGSLWERLEALEEQVARLTALCQSLQEAARRPVEEKEAGGFPAGGPEGEVPASAGEGATAFPAVLRRAEEEAWRREIYAAADAGEDPTSIARRLGRGKGEIELILRLRGKS